jgi:hypothetical protein
MFKERARSGSAMMSVPVFYRRQKRPETRRRQRAPLVLKTQKTLPRSPFSLLSNRLLEIFLRKLKLGCLVNCHNHFQFVVGLDLPERSKGAW